MRPFLETKLNILSILIRMRFEFHCISSFSVQFSPHPQTVFRKNLADFANVLSSHIREVIQNETEGAYKPEALSFTTFWKVLKSFKKRPSESEDARKVFKQKIEDEKVLSLYHAPKMTPYPPSLIGPNL